MASKPGTSKKKGIVVRSRYKQAADTFSSQSSKDSSQYTKLYTTRTDLSRRSERSFPKSSTSSEKDISSAEKSEIIGQCTSSTPTSEGHCSLPPIDESIINNNLLQVPNKKERKAFPSKKGSSQQRADQTLNFSVRIPSDSFKDQGKTKQSNTEDEIDLLYTEYLQAKLLESYSMKAFENRYEDTLKKVYQIWSYIQVLMNKNMSTQQELSFTSHLLILHEHLQKQEKMLLPILDAIPTLEMPYEAIAKGVYTAMHNLKFKNVILPDTDCQEEIIALLNKIFELAQNIFTEIQDSNKIILTADAKHAFVNLGTLIGEILEECSDMLSEANKLLLSETSTKLASLNLD